MSLDLGEYIAEKRIGMGAFAEVWQGHHKATHKQVAVKIVDLERLSRNAKEDKLKQHMHSEMQIMKSLDHQNIVKMFNFEENEKQIIMFLELCEGGDFSKYIRKHKRLSEENTKYFMRQLAAGLEVLRKQKIIHRDLKPQNLLLSDTSEKPTLKIADFGFARYIDTQSLAHTLCGSPLYMAPEILGQKDYTIKADLWSVGVICYEMLVGTPLFSEAKNHIALFAAIESFNTRDLSFSNFDPTPECKDLLKRLLEKDPTKRMTWEEFFMHPWLKNTPHPSQQQQQQSSPSNLPSHPPLIHSKSQAAIINPSPVRNFLHDERMLQQNIFNVFSNTTSPSSSSTSSNMSNTSSPSSSTTNQHVLPRAHSTSVLPAYKLPPATSNMNVPNGSVTSSNSTSSSSRNTPPDNNKYNHRNSINMNNNYNYNYYNNNNTTTTSSSPHSQFTGPSSLPNNVMTSGSPLANPSISPTTSFSNQRLPYSLAPVSASPPNSNNNSNNSNNTSNIYSVQKTVSFAEPYKVPSQKRLSIAQHPSYCQKPFLVPKFTATSSDSFEKDCVILNNSNGISSGELSTEDQVYEQVDAKYKRFLVVSDVGDLKVNADLEYEAFVIYLRGLEGLMDLLDFAKQKAKDHSLFSSSRLSELTKNIVEKAMKFKERVDYWKVRLRSSEPLPRADEIIYNQAMHMGRLAAVSEDKLEYDRSEEIYYSSILLLENLLEDSEEEEDREVLHKYISAFSRRLVSVQGKLRIPQ